MSAKPYFLFILALAAACQQPADAAEQALLAPVATRPSREAGPQTAIFAGGCFWGVEAVFSHVDGVTSAVSGFHGGSADDAAYDAVSAGGTGHAEAVRVTYDPARVRYDQLLRVYFSVVADPTQLNRQGPDSGTQYRGALIPTSDEQRQTATAYLGQLRAANLWSRPIVTRVEPYRRFHLAEAYHQDYLEKHPDSPYIVRYDAPKLRALRQLFPQLYRAAAAP